MAKKGNQGTHDPEDARRFRYLSEKYLGDIYINPMQETRENIAQQYNISLDHLDAVAEKMGLRRIATCGNIDPTCGHPKPALPLDQLQVPWERYKVRLKNIGWRRMRKAGFNIDIPDENLNNLPLALANMPEYMARHYALMEWKAIMDQLRWVGRAEGIIADDSIFVLAGLGRRDMQTLGKAIIFPELLTPGERWTAQGYPTPEQATENIRQMLGQHNLSIEQVVQRVAHQPATITYRDCSLITNAFSVELFFRHDLDIISPKQRTEAQGRLLQTQQYVDVGHLVTRTVRGFPDARSQTNAVARRATQTKDEFLARQNCWFRRYLRGSDQTALGSVSEEQKSILLRLLRDCMLGEPEEFHSLYEDFLFEHLDELRLVGFPLRDDDTTTV